MTSPSRQHPTEELAHLAWCILTAIKLATKEGKVLSSTQVHKFIMQWLATAQKKKLFPKSLAPDIIWLQQHGQRLGIKARLYSKIEYIWLANSGELEQQSTLFRFTYLIDTLRTMGWQDHLLTAYEWEQCRQADKDTDAIYTPKEKLHPSFTENGVLIQPLPFRVTGGINDVLSLITQCGLIVEQLQDENGFYALRLLPESREA